LNLRLVRFNCRAGPGDYRRHLPRGFSSMLLSAIRSRGSYALIDRCPNPAASYSYAAALAKALDAYGRRESVPRVANGISTGVAVDRKHCGVRTRLLAADAPREPRSANRVACGSPRGACDHLRQAMLEELLRRNYGKTAFITASRLSSTFTRPPNSTRPP